MKIPIFKIGIALALSFSMTWNAHADTANQPLLGTYILSWDNARWNTPHEKSTICQRFTANLNEFRHVPYHSCDPRLSSRHAEFSRPAWEEIPFDLAVAERFIRDRFGRYIEAPEKEKSWRQWLAATRELRAKGLARLWRARIDFDRDGYEETVYRVLPDSNGKLNAGWTTPPFTCEFLQGSMHMEDNRDQWSEEHFNVDQQDDMIRDAIDGRYYYVFWHSWGPVEGPYPAHGPENIPAPPGATAGLVLIEREGQGRGEACRINWVPAKSPESADAMPRSR